MTTCVYDASGCRVALPMTCSQGCDGAECATCGSLAQPLRGTASTDPRFYDDVVLNGSTAIAIWRGRSGSSALQNYGLEAFDISDPKAPVSTASVQLYPASPITHLTIWDGKLYFLGAQTLQIRDAADPTGPALGSFDLKEYGSDLSVDAGLACVTTSSGLRLIDISAPAKPEQVGVLPVTTAAPSQVVCKGARAAITVDRSIQIVNLSPPSAPQIMATLEVGLMAGNQDTLQFDGSRVYVAAAGPAYNNQSWFTFRVYGFTEPSQLTLLGTAGEVATPLSAKLASSTLWFSTVNGIGSIDVSVPNAPVLKKLLSTEWPRGLAHDGTTVYYTSDRLQAVDPSLASNVQTAPAPDDALEGVDVQGAIAYEVRENKKLVLKDVRNPLAPVELSRVSIAGTDVRVRGRYAYVTARPSTNVARLHIFDVGDPWHPVQVGVVDGSAVSGGGMDRMQLVGNRVYAMCNVGRICVFDVSDPSAPTLVTVSDVIVQTLGSASASSPYAVSGSTLYLPDGEKLTVVDFSDPLAPVTIGTFTMTAQAAGQSSIVADGNRLYIVSRCDSALLGLCTNVVDISQPHAPVLLGESIENYRIHSNLYPIYTAPYDQLLRVKGGYLYYSTAWGGVFTWDVRDPQHPRGFTEYWTIYPPKQTYQIDRYLLGYVESTFPYPHEPADLNQVIDLCQ
jgi:hypothetical protein